MPAPDTAKGTHSKASKNGRWGERKQRWRPLQQEEQKGKGGEGADWRKGMAMARMSWGLLRRRRMAIQGFSMPFRASLASTMVSNSATTSLVPRTCCSTTRASLRYPRSTRLLGVSGRNKPPAASKPCGGTQPSWSSPDSEQKGVVGCHQSQQKRGVSCCAGSNK